MKCENCNAKEASFYYSSNINGRKQERHLCADCARAEGFGSFMDSGSAMFDGSAFSMFDDFFSPVRSFMGLPSFDMFGGLGRSIMAPSLPRLRFVVDDDRQQSASAAPTMEPGEAKIPNAVDEEARHRREVEALKAQLHDAVAAEDYEKAIVLRDRLRGLEG